MPRENVIVKKDMPQREMEYPSLVLRKDYYKYCDICKMAKTKKWFWSSLKCNNDECNAGYNNLPRFENPPPPPPKKQIPIIKHPAINFIK